MTGSRKAFIYEDDFGTQYGVTKDESSAEAIIGSSTLFFPYAIGVGQLRKGIKMRYVNTVSVDDPAIRKRFEIGRKNLFDSIVTGTEITEPSGGLGAGGEYTVLSKRGERAQFLAVADTAQVDGDNP